MRKILNKKDNSKRNQLILGIGLIIIMIFSTLGYALSGRGNEDKGEKIEYKGIEFIQDNSEYWKFKAQGYEFLTKYNPEEVQNIEFNGNLFLSNYQDKPLYFVGVFNEPNAEIARNLERFVLRMQEACVNEEDCTGDYPIKDCFKDNIIIITESENNESEVIYQQNGCVYISASLINQTRYADKFIYTLLGI